jgi:hypothetical protein
MQLQIAVCAVLAAVAMQQSLNQLWLLLFQLLLLAAVAAAAVVTAQSSSSNRECTATTAGQQAGVAAAAAPQPSTDSSSTLTEDIHCCGWSIVLVGADLCSTPSRHLQLQVRSATY